MFKETFKKILSLFHIQFSKFIVVGIINTGVDLAVLNLLVLFFGVNQSIYPMFKTISFLLAVTNSYLMNRFWVFSNLPRNKTVKSESLLFLLVSVCGFILNVVTAYLAFRFTISIYPEKALIATNLGAILGTLVVLFSNFFGYKFIVFR